MKRRVVQLVDLSQIAIVERDIPHMGENEVLIKVKAVGICGSDTSYYKKGATGMGNIKYPHVLGHECAGDVVAIGEGVTHLQVGDRVCIEPGVPCGQCEYCRGGQYNLCEEMAFMSSAILKEGNEGGMADYIVRPAQFVYPLPEEVDYVQGALLEPISVAYHAVKRSGILPGQKAAILGCGPIAGSLLLVLKAMGISFVAMSDISQGRLDRMQSLGADKLISVAKLQQEELRNVLVSEVDAVFDTTCNMNAINASINWLKKGKTLVLVGVLSSAGELDLQKAFAKELNIHFSFRYADTYPQVIAWTANGMISPEKLVTHEFSLDEAGEAMALAAESREEVMKIVIKNFNGDSIEI